MTKEIVYAQIAAVVGILSGGLVWLMDGPEWLAVLLLAGPLLVGLLGLVLFAFLGETKRKVESVAWIVFLLAFRFVPELSFWTEPLYVGFLLGVFGWWLFVNRGLEKALFSG